MWPIQSLLSTENQTLVIVLMFVLLVLALILLPAASFIRLVELIRDSGSKVAAVHKDIQQVQTTLLDVMANVSSFSRPIDTPITPASVDTLSTESIPETKSRKSS